MSERGRPRWQLTDESANNIQIFKNVSQPTVIHCLDSYLPTTENWLYGLIKHQSQIRRMIASDRFLECDFPLRGVERLRFPLQPKLNQSTPVIGFIRWWRAFARLAYPLYLRVVLRNTHVDIVHSHFGQVGWRYRKIAKRLGAVHVVSFYGWDYVRLAASAPSWKQRLQQLYVEADCFLCEGPHGAALLKKNGCPDSKVRVAKLGVEPASIPYFLRRKQSGVLRLLQLASFKEKKGHIDTVNAFASALRDRPDLRLTLIGAVPGKIYGQVANAVRSLGIEDKVDLLPGVSFDKLYTTMQEHHVFIHPSRHAPDGDCEGGAPVVLLDAQATGMPVITTKHCDIPREVIDGITGVLCAEGDVQALAAAIVQFCDMNEVEYVKYANAARQHIVDHFDVKNCAIEVEQIYRDLVTEHGSGSA